MPRRVAEPNLKDLVRKAAKNKGKLTPEEIAFMALTLVYETGDDTDGVHAHRGRLKLDSLKLLHQINLDNKEPTDGDSDVEILRLLNERKKIRSGHES